MALPINRRASAVGVTTVKAPIVVGAQLREEVTLILAQAATGTVAGSLDTPVEVFANTDLNNMLGVGYGSPINLAKEAFFKAEQGVKLYVLPVGDPAAGTAATGTITAATGTASKPIPLNIWVQGAEVSGVLALGEDQDAAATLIKALMDTLTRNPFTTSVVANVVTTTAIAEGTVCNGVDIQIYDNDGKAITAAEYGIDITVVAMAGGAGDPATATAIANIPETLKITRIVTHLKDTLTLDAIKQLADDRNTPELGEIIRGYHGERVDSTDTSTINSEYTRVMALSDVRILDDVNTMIPTDCNGLEIEAVSYMVGLLVQRYSINPGKPPRGLNLNINAAIPRSRYWFSSSQRDAMYKNGITNLEKQTGYMKLFDLCVMYHPANDNIMSENPPVLFNDEDATAIGNMQYSVIQTFRSPQWEAVKFIDNTDITSNTAARKLIDVGVQVDALVSDWLDPFLFVKNIAYTKLNKIIAFAGDNSERVNMNIPVTLASTGRIYDMTLSATKANR